MSIITFFKVFKKWMAFNIIANLETIFLQKLLMYILNKIAVANEKMLLIDWILETVSKKGDWLKIWLMIKNSQFLHNQADIKAILPAQVGHIQQFS